MTRASLADRRGAFLLRLLREVNLRAKLMRLILRAYNRTSFGTYTGKEALENLFMGCKIYFWEINFINYPVNKFDIQK